MRSTLTATILLAGTAVVSAAHAQSYVMHPFTIPGASSVAVTAVNDSGVAVGSYVSTSHMYGAGFVGHRGAVTTMALAGTPSADYPQGYIPVPTSINDYGSIVGFYAYANIADDGTSNTYSNIFAYRDGSYLKTLAQSVNNAQFPMSDFPPSVNTNDWYSLNVTNPDGSQNAETGLLSKTGAPYDLSSVTSFVASVNAHGIAAGSGSGAVFVIQSSKVSYNPYHVPPGGKSSSGGWINDANLVAGSYIDEHGGLHGFILQDGKYTIFDMPVRPDSLTTQAIDQSGRVYGVFTKGYTQSAFVYDAGTVFRLKDFPLADKVHVAASHRGMFLAVADTTKSGVTQSFLAVPSGQ